MKIYRLINNKNWCQNSMCVSEDGEDLRRPADPRAVKWCAFGWIMKAYPENLLAHNTLRFTRAVKKKCIIDWNDDPKRTIKQVKAAFKRCGL